MFSKVAAPFSTPPALCDGSNFSIYLPILVTVCLFQYRHPHRCDVVSLIVLICISWMTNDGEHLSTCPFVYLWRNVNSNPCPFFIRLCFCCWICKSVLYVLYTSPLLDIRFTKFFSWSVDCVLFSWWYHLWYESFKLWSPFYLFFFLLLLVIFCCHI